MQENDPDQGWRDELVRVALNTGEVRGKRLIAWAASAACYASYV